MIEFFKFRMSEITKVLKYMDIDTFNQMMDKRTADFEEILSTINTLTDEINDSKTHSVKMVFTKQTMKISRL